MVEAVSVKMNLSARFQHGGEKDLALNGLTTMTVNMILVTKETKVTTIFKKPEEAVGLEKGYYYSFYVFIV